MLRYIVHAIKQLNELNPAEDYTTQGGIKIHFLVRVQWKKYAYLPVKKIENWRAGLQLLTKIHM